MSVAQRSAWSPLGYPVFRALWIASVASHIGSYMTDVGQGWLMATLAPSPMFVALLYTAESLPFFAFGLPAGALADIVDRRRLLMITQVAMAVAVGTLALVTLTGIVTPWMLLGLAFALGTATALNDPAWQSIVPELLPKEELAGGITLNGVGINVARTLGPAIGGFVVAAAGPGSVFVLDALSFLGVVAALATWRRERSPSVLPAERMVAAIRAGLRFARHSRPLRRVLLRVFAFMFCGAGVMALMPVLARETGHGAIAFGLLLGSFGTGAVLGATVLPRIRARLSVNALLAAGSLALAVVALGLALLRELAVLCPLLAVGGGAWITTLSTLNVAAQEASPPWVKARALAVYLIVFQAGIAGGSALWGGITAHAGLGAAYGGIAAGLALGCALTARRAVPEDEALDHTPSHHWPDPEVAGEPSLEAGPIMVQVEYSVDPSRADAFRSAMYEIGRNRRRDGAVQWWLFQDTADESKFVETWVESTWAEHLRNHERVSIAQREIEQRVREMTRAAAEVRIRHYIAADQRTPAGGSAGPADARTSA